MPSKQIRSLEGSASSLPTFPGVSTRTIDIRALTKQCPPNESDPWREVLRHFPLFPAFPPTTIDIRALPKQCPPNKSDPWRGVLHHSPLSPAFPPARLISGH